MATIDVEYENIGRVRLQSKTIAKIAYTINTYGYEWTHSSADWYRKLVLIKLRRQQKNRCCYCRRTINYNKGAYELDHIIDKGSKGGRYGRFCFDLRNLALACKDCNNNKGTKAVLFKDLSINAPYPTDKAVFNWVHPHLHDYSEHISIHTGWIYEAKSGNSMGLQVITHCKLDQLSAKEAKNRRAHVMGAASVKEALSRVAGYKTEAGLDTLCKQFGKSLGSRWKKGDAEIEAAIRGLVEFDPWQSAG
jgi:uncharacterized protein (TIGR02646 family)